ncbi:hypothetical protein R6Q59_008001 [Mikania micrantha]
MNLALVLPLAHGDRPYAPGDLVEQDLILQAVRYERRNFEQKGRNSPIGKERKTKQCQELRQSAVSCKASQQEEAVVI